MRGAPQRGLARLIFRIRFRTSGDTHGRPSRWRLFQFQYSRNPLRCQAMTVSGLTRSSAERQSFHNRESQTHKTWSAQRRRSLRPRLERCKTRSWCRSARISACRTARARKQSRREKSMVSMVWEGYRSRLCKCNNFNENGLFGRDNSLSASVCSPCATRLSACLTEMSVGTGCTIARDFIEKKTIRKLRVRILPFVFLLYIAAYLDRVNI